MVTMEVKKGEQEAGVAQMNVIIIIVDITQARLTGDIVHGHRDEV